MCNRSLLPSGTDVVPSASAPWRLSIASLVTALLLCSLLGKSGAQPTNPGTKRPDLFRAGESTRKPSKGQTVSATPSPQRQRPNGPTEITAQGSSEFDNSARLAVFLEDVVVVDPEFTLYCDRLTVYLKSTKDLSKQEAATAAASPGGGGIDHAIAEATPGNQVTILKDKLEADGSLTKSVAHADRAIYHARTGDLVLTGNPSLQQGGSFIIAAEPGTVMTLNRNGDMVNKGATRTILKEIASTEKQK